MKYFVLILIFLWAYCSNAATGTTLYYGKLTYKDSAGIPQNKSEYVGFNTYATSKKRLIEADLRHSADSTLNAVIRLHRYNIAGAFSQYSKDGAFRVGGHYSFSDVDGSLEMLSFFAGGKVFELRRYELGINGYHTTLSNLSDKKIDVWQAELFYQYFSKSYGDRDGFSLKATPMVIRIPKWLADTSDDASVVNGSIKLDSNFYKKRFHANANFWIGRRIYPALNQGMELEYRDYIQKGGIGISARYKVKDKFWVKLGVTQTYLETFAGESDFASTDYYISLKF